MPSEASAFGEKVFEAACRAAISSQAEVDATAEVWTIGLAVKPSVGNTVFLPYTDAEKLEASNFHVSVGAQGSSISLSRFGAKYDQFVLELGKRYSDAIAKALLMDEPRVVNETQCSYSAAVGGPQVTGQGRARIYETALVLLPANARPMRFPFSLVTSVDLQGYKVVVSSTMGAVELSRLGNATQFFADKLREAMRSLEAATVETIKSMVPSANFNELNELARPMAEGRAASRKVVETISPDLWKRIELSVGQSPLAETYQHLSAMGESALSSIGLRKAMERTYVWFLIPVMGSAEVGGNAVAMEVTSEGGHATYLFWVVPRSEFPKATKESWYQQAEGVAFDLNEAIIATGLRREPIYLTSDQLNTPEYGKYLYAAANLEPLRFLRERFFARVVHTTFEQWKKDLQEALLFNVTAPEGSARWGRSSLEFIEFGQPSRVPPVPTAPAPSAGMTVAAPTLQALNVEAGERIVVSEKVYTLQNMEADDRGNIKLWLHDVEMDSNTEIKITGDQASKLSAFPGSKIKVTLQKM